MPIVSETSDATAVPGMRSSLRSQNQPSDSQPLADSTFTASQERLVSIAREGLSWFNPHIYKCQSSGRHDFKDCVIKLIVVIPPYMRCKAAAFSSLRSGQGQRLVSEGRCILAGVARVAPVDDPLLDPFLMLPTDCLARLPAQFIFSNQA